MNTSGRKWGLIGASNIAATRMIPALRSSGHEISTIYSSSAERARDFSHAHDIPTSTDSLDELTGSAIDAVYISSVNTRHAQQAMAAISQGLHVLCEKPLALTLDDARAMITAAQEANTVLAVNHHLPGSPLHATVRQLVTDGRIGRVLSARVNHAVMLPQRLQGWRVTSDDEGAGVVLDITCHDASVLNPLLGSPKKVTAFSVSQGPWGHGAADAAMTVIEYGGPDGHPVLAQTHDAFTIAHASTSLTVHGTEGTITVHDAMTQTTNGQLFITDTSGVHEVVIDTQLDLYEIVVTAFNSAIHGEGRPTATGEAGMAALQVALAAQESARTGQSIDITCERS